MLKRLLALLIAVLVCGVGIYTWRRQHGESAPPPLGAAADDLKRGAHTFGAEAKEKLGEVGREIGDTKLALSVKTALRVNRTLHPYRIDAKADQGLVTLDGQVDRDELRSRAGEIAAAVPNVTRVVNQVQVIPGLTAPPEADRTLGETLDDHALEMKVRIALSLNKALKGSDLTVNAYRRQVTLGGAVATDAQRELALQTARDTAPSESRVVDQIVVRGASLPNARAREAL